MKQMESLSDTSKLRGLLNSLSRELDETFLEKRAKNRWHKATPLEELNDVITELSNREKELQAAVGIALMLLDNTEILQCKMQRYKQKVLQAKEKSHHLTIEVKTLSESLETVEKKSEDLKSALIHAEESLLIHSQEIQILLREKKYQFGSNSERELDEMKKDFVSQMQVIENKKNDIERNYKRTEEALKRKETELQKCKDEKNILELQYQKLEDKHESLKKQFTSLEEKLKQTQDLKEASDESSKLANANYQRIKLFSERLEEELLILEQKKPQETFHAHDNLSLFSELSLLDHHEDPLLIQNQHEDYLEDAFFMKSHHSINPSTRFTSIQSYSKLFSLVTNHIGVTSKKSFRRPAPEEYFFLATQVLKMNSPYMDSICSVSPQKLYEKALKEDVPFHKWYEWIEKQLSSIYIRKLYKKNAKFSWVNRSQKKQLITPT
ncbi:hypothetical protein SteCoe_16417 [Stentor coeruleus]|uniref:Uncharacterized protein n=1 Tax=Stentor coeruleus TaxID=5963 RepID=A0A1R2C1B3_9CILI|nr:hypothetical protein SteCoe_16417 [Stentor coeruleus]